MDKVKIFAAYLPQYHEIEENNKWWGKGYTDWVSVKRALPQYKGHKQPRVPLNNEYYRLDDVNEINKQAKMAKMYGVDGFAIYHYWFSHKQKLLTKPAELLLEHKEIEIEYFFVWDNNSWVNKTWKNVKFTNNWVSDGRDGKDANNNDNNGMLAEVKYESENEWLEHYNYLSPFFKDSRYYKIDGKPVMGIFSPTNDFHTLKRMISFLNKCAVEDGHNGITFISAATFSKTRFDYDFRYEPFNVWSPIDYLCRKIKIKKSRGIKRYSYDQLWGKILKNAFLFRNKRTILGAFVGYDDTPRRGKNASIVIGQTPNKFYKYMKKIISISRKQNKPFIYLTAWNEWGEGAYLEPDNADKYAYLEALKRAVDENDN